jgi:ORF6N domain
MKMKKDIVPIEVIENRIYLIRGQKVMLDRDLAKLYDVETRALKQAVKRNLNRFPDDFMFILNSKEVNLLVSHFVIPSGSYFGGSAPFAFTEHGILMLSSVLNSQQAIDVNIMIMRAFVKLRQILSTHKELSLKITELERKYEGHDVEIQQIFEAIKQLMNPPVSNGKRIGFRTGKDV